MSERFICGGNKYELMGLNENVISLSVSFENLPKKIQVKEDTFYLPSPFHISLIYIQRIIDNYNILIPDFFNKIIEDFCDFTKTNNIELIGYKNEYKLVERNGKKTIVVMCEVSNLNKFFDLINEKYELNIKYPTTHVTLYNVLKGEPGVYLMDSDDIKNFTTPIPNPIGYSL
jgi:hypothetical protein